MNAKKNFYPNNLKIKHFDCLEKTNKTYFYWVTVMSNKQKILIGISGGIAAYKTPDLIRRLLENNYEIKVILTKHASEFVSILTLQTLLPGSIYCELIEPEMHHIKLAKWADLILIAPCTANTISKLRAGFSDNLLSTICLVTNVPIFLAPAMNQSMWLNPTTQENVTKLISRGIKVLGPDTGIQACGDNGPGRMLEPLEIISILTETNILNGINRLITVGATCEPIDPVRYITNRSSGKMGFSIAKAARLLGANVTIISGKTSINPPACDQLINVTTAAEMHSAVKNIINQYDIFISVAAVSDFYVEKPNTQKIKRAGESISLTLLPCVDILSDICSKEIKPFTVGFAAETENVLENGKAKRLKKALILLLPMMYHVKMRVLIAISMRLVLLRKTKFCT